MKEIWDKVDLHENNRRFLSLPSRLIAKIFVFRLIYGGSCFSYASDPDFNSVGFSAKKWQGVIDAFYEKYEGLAIWHRYLMHEATTTGRVVCPTGRYFTFKPYLKKAELVWPRTTILNYPVQGTGADLVSLARVEFFRLFKERKIEGVLISSVHDSLVCDVPKSSIEICVQTLSEAVSRVPMLFEQRFGVEFNLPLSSEILVGPNQKDLHEISL